MALITGLIPQQGFEKVLYQIGVILLTELTEQKDNHSNMVDFSVFVERMIPYDKSEGVMINVTSNSVNFNGQTESSSQGNTGFNIEVYSPLEHTSITPNDGNTFTLHKVLGLIRYILSSTKYKTLGLPLGLIGGTYVDSISFADDFNNQDGANIRMGVVLFSVRVMENQDLWDGIPLLGGDTTIKLDETDLGYKLIKNN